MEHAGSNVVFEHWGKVFGDEVIASAILDRLLHVSHIFFGINEQASLPVWLAQPR